jgi:hypothetical protein
MPSEADIPNAKADRPSPQIQPAVVVVKRTKQEWPRGEVLLPRLLSRLNCKPTEIRVQKQGRRQFRRIGRQLSPRIGSEDAMRMQHRSPTPVDPGTCDRTALLGCPATWAG